MNPNIIYESELNIPIAVGTLSKPKLNRSEKSLHPCLGAYIHGSLVSLKLSAKIVNTMKTLIHRLTKLPCRNAERSLGRDIGNNTAKQNMVNHTILPVSLLPITCGRSSLPTNYSNV